MAALGMALIGLVAVVGPRSKAQAQHAQQPLRAARSLRVADAGAAKIDDLGPTFQHLERKATRVRTRYQEATALVERGVDGDFRTRLHDAGGNELSQFAVTHDSLGGARLELSAGGERVTAPPRAELRPTLDWANLQAYALWKDHPDAGDQIEWQGRFVRGRGPKGASLDDAPIETETEFDGDIRVVTAKNARDVEVGPRMKRRPTFVSHVFASGVDVGTIRWYEREKVLAWDYPGLTKGFVNAERLQTNGAWPFKPTMAWANVQGLAFYEFHSKLKARGTVAERRPGLLQRIAQSIAPTVSANTAGCDGLHWLDSSIFRPCCDTHDRCYQRIGCSSVSWFWAPIWGSTWSCNSCNASVTVCFATGGLFNYDVQDIANYW
jgi:hypothetical protein